VAVNNDDPIGEELARWGKVALIETRGRVSDRTSRAAIGFIQAADGTLLVAAGSRSTNWALNLGVNPECTVTIGDKGATYRAVPVDGEVRSQALVDLILKYGTPAERLGRGSVYRLVPTVEGSGEPG
jgi:deazaflavin-dependent oxidoreductase (nitroreductase family)